MEQVAPSVHFMVEFRAIPLCATCIVYHFLLLYGCVICDTGVHAASGAKRTLHGGGPRHSAVCQPFLCLYVYMCIVFMFICLYVYMFICVVCSSIIVIASSVCAALFVFGVALIIPCITRGVPIYSGKE